MKPPWGAAALAGAGVFGLYAATLAPTTGFWDASEYIATAHILGIPHPPGNPLFVVLARTWTILLAPTGLSVAVRVNLFAAATSALASFFFFLVAWRVAREVVRTPWMAVAGAAAATLLGATAFTVWNQSTVNEKVYTVSLAVIAAVTWLVIRWRDERGRPGSERWLLAALYVLVLGSTNHLMSVLPLPAVAVLVAVGGAGVLLRPAFWVRAVPLVLLGLSFNLMLPVRSAQDPVINEGEPTCATADGAVAAVLTLGRTGCPDLAAVLRREQYAKPPVTERMAPASAQATNWFQYFDWQWARGVDPSELPGNGRLPFTLLFLGLGLAGLWAAFRADRAIFLYLGTLALLLTAGLVYYLNFRYGYSLSPEVADRTLHEVRERDYFFVAGFMLWGVLAGLGLTWTWAVVAGSLSWPRPAVATSPILAVAAIPLVLNVSWASRAGDWAARDWAYDLLMSVEPYAVLFTNGDNDTFPLWYLQEVEGVRRDVTVVVGQYLFTDWYLPQLRRHSAPGRQRPFGGDTAVALYGVPAAMPSGSITELGPSEIATVRSGVLPQDLTVAFPTMAVTFPAGMGLDRSHRLALRIIRDSIVERPIYFAGTAGMMNEMGLTPWAVRHGLTAKLVLRPLEGDQPSGVVQGGAGFGGEWFDVPRTLRLYEEVYRYRGLRERAIWADRATLNIPWQYYALALQLADVGARSGVDAATLNRLQADAEAFYVVSQGGWAGTPGRLLGEG